ncbi:MAG: precorrin-2 C(20)-methyltransferase [Bacillota bacterium]
MLVSGKLFGVGIGPGDPEMITLKAVRVLSQVDVLCIPKSREDRESLALSIVRQVIHREWEVLEFYLPMTTEQDCLEEAWDAGAQKIVERLKRGQDLAFITLGDPSLYSTYGYLLEKVLEMEPEITVETIPGITSFCAAAAWLNLSLGEDKEGLAVIPAARPMEELETVLKSFENVVLLKSGKRFPQIVELLDRMHLTGSSVLVSRCGLPGGFFARDITTMAEQEQDYLSMVLVKSGQKEVDEG